MEESEGSSYDSAPSGGKQRSSSQAPRNFYEEAVDETKSAGAVYLKTPEMRPAVFIPPQTSGNLASQNIAGDTGHSLCPATVRHKSRKQSLFATNKDWTQGTSAGEVHTDPRFGKSLPTNMSRTSRLEGSI